ncbi:MAG TPA: hypothetical protein ENK18_25530 [Deltaproteobacteria bacterium]|nr:hypothetical protein [Deltaproteobacteria bacterium]
MTLRVRSLLLVALTAASLNLVADTSWAKRKKGPPDVVEDALAFSTTDRDRAIQLLEDALAGRKLDKDSSVILLHAGEQRRLNGDAAEAGAWFAKVLSISATGTEAPAARLGQALIQAAEGDTSRPVMSTLRNTSDRDVLDTQNADRYLLLAIDAARSDEARSVSSYSKRALSFAQTDPEVLARVEQTLQELAQSPPSEITPPAIGEGAGGPLEEAEEAYLRGDLEGARRQAERAAGDPDPRIAEAAAGLLRTLNGAPVRSDQIAVVLPLSDRYGSVGNNVREALLYGFGGSAGRLRFYDSGSTAETAVAALEGAVLQDGAIAVIGPLLSDESEAMVEAAESLHVPLISLSQSYEPTEDAVWAFQAMHTWGDQIDALLEWVMTQRGMSSFATFSPDKDFGNNAVALFEAKVIERGGQLRAQATYSPEEKNLLPFAVEFGERADDLAQKKREAERNGGNPDTAVASPIIDFDAIFIPESSLRTPLVCAALAYQEFPMGTFQPVKGQPELPLLGLSTWNNEDLIATGNEYIRNSLFTDVFSSSVRPEGDPLIEGYRQATGRTLSSLEAAVIDAGKLVGAAANAGATHRGAFRDALVTASVSDSITGASGFDPETLRARRNMLILTLTRDSIDAVGEIPLHGATPSMAPPVP